MKSRRKKGVKKEESGRVRMIPSIRERKKLYIHELYREGGEER